MPKNWKYNLKKLRLLLGMSGSIGQLLQEQGDLTIIESDRFYLIKMLEKYSVLLIIIMSLKVKSKLAYASHI